LYISLRECEIGEEFTDAGKCIECPANESYSLIKFTEPNQCTDCPSDKAQCLGGSKVGPQPGYWRKSEYTYTFIRCLYS